MSKSNLARAKEVKKTTGKTVQLSSGKTRNIYFTSETQEYIVRYNASTNEIEKNKLFNKIYPTLNKVAHNLIYKYKLLTDDTSFQDLKSDVVTHLYEKIDKFDPTKGSAFTYFSVVTFHYLLARKQQIVKLAHNKYEIDTLEMPSSLDIEIYERLNEDSEDITNEKIDNFVKYFQQHIKLHFHKKEDFEIANAILQLIVNSKDLSFPMNNKSVYFLVKEQIGCKQSDILRIIRRFKIIYKRVAYTEDFNG